MSFFLVDDVWSLVIDLLAQRTAPVLCRAREVAAVARVSRRFRRLAARYATIFRRRHTVHRIDAAQILTADGFVFRWPGVFRLAEDVLVRNVGARTLFRVDFDDDPTLEYNSGDSREVTFDLGAREIVIDDPAVERILLCRDARCPRVTVQHGTFARTDLVSPDLVLLQFPTPKHATPLRDPRHDSLGAPIRLLEIGWNHVIVGIKASGEFSTAIKW